MIQYGLSKIEVLINETQTIPPFNTSRNLTIFEEANYTLSGDYLIITEHKEDDIAISKVLNLAHVHSYKITNNNK